jgi:FtsZ-binding cell division protein ZapB
MGKKQIAIPLFVIFLLPLAFITVAKTETRLVWSFDWEGIDVEVYAPYQAYPGDTITIRVRTAATKNLRDVEVSIWLYGSKLDGYDTWTGNITVLHDVDISTGEVLDQNFNVSIPSDVSPGPIYGHTYCKWKVGKHFYFIPRELDDSFIATYLKNKAYEDLQVAYSDLLNDHNTLLANYSDLLDDYNSLSADYISLNSTYYDLLNMYNQLQSDYGSLQESFDTLNYSYSALNSTYHDLLDTYNQLQSDYNSLQENFDTLNNNYSNLQVNYDSLHDKWEDLKSKNEASKANLSNTWNLSYILIITTLIFIATTVYLAVRKPKVKPKLEAT